MLKSCVILSLFALLWQEGERQDLQDRVEALEGRLDRAETTLEFSEAYGRVRIEHSPGLTDLWTRIDSREIPGNRIKEEASKIIDDEVKAQLSIAAILGVAWQIKQSII